MTSTPTTEMGPIYYLDATKLATLIRTKQSSSREVVQAHLDRIRAVNPKINAIVTLMADDALKGRTPLTRRSRAARSWASFTVFRSPSRTRSTPRAY